VTPRLNTCAALRLSGDVGSDVGVASAAKGLRGVAAFGAGLQTRSEAMLTVRPWEKWPWVLKLPVIGITPRGWWLTPTAT